MNLTELCKRLSAAAMIALLAAGCSLDTPVPGSNGGDNGVAPTPTIAPVSGGPTGDLARVTYVVDGDTIEVEMNGSTFRVRYIGVNTPETDEACYAEASAANAALVDGQNVILVRDVSETDRFNRLLRYIYLTDGTSVNERLVREGWAEAVEYRPDTRFTAQYREIEIEAAANGRGCHPTGIFDDGTLTR
jgi:endonuclease YncB( thermonuclease family)